MKSAIGSIHIVLGVWIVVSSVSGQAVLYSKLHRTDRYYSQEDLRNPGIAGHIADLRRSEPRRIVEGGLALSLGVLSIAGAIALYREKRWALLAVPSTTTAMIVAVFYVTRGDTGLAAAAAVLPALCLTMVLGIELRYVLRKRSP